MRLPPKVNVYRLDVSATAKRDLEKLEGRIIFRDFERLLDAIESLINEPRPHWIRKTKGEERLYRIRAGNYRIIYEIYDEQNLIMVLRVTRRNEAKYKL